MTTDTPFNWGWAPLVIAALTIFAALLTGDLLTAKSRLRRRLDKEMGIASRLEEGFAKAELHRMIRRDLLALIFRSQRPDRHIWLGRMMLVVALGVILPPAILSVFESYPSVSWFSTVAGGLAGASLAVAAQYLLIEPKWKCDRFIQKHMADDQDIVRIQVPQDSTRRRK